MDPSQFVTAAVAAKSPELLNNWLNACRIALNSLAESSETVRPPPETRKSRPHSFTTVPEVCGLFFAFFDAYTLYRVRHVSQLWCSCAESENLWIPFFGSAEKAVWEWMDDQVCGEPPEDSTSECEGDLPLVSRGRLLPRKPKSIASVIGQFMKLDAGMKLAKGSGLLMDYDWGQPQYQGHLGYSLVVDAKVNGRTVVSGRYCLQLPMHNLATHIYIYIYSVLMDVV